ncbi:hypothetical protein [Photorhabdus australis]|uniref:hypothetical protein n=1 Tax=Photorhabdus australis TaxID=286156 RepID=UPI000565D080|nr:hypothetical protein [Photorhabdus australis]
MNNQDALFSIVKDDIAFDTLLTQAKTIIKQQSGQCWSDMGENDPGITLLEACCYSASDLAYRHSLPLRDLLTPEQEEQISGDGIFPQEFGPQQMLTCGPITAEDYRRALLDLHSGDTLNSDDTVHGYFLFNDVLLICEPEGQRYEYWYNKEKREYRFKNSGTDGKLTLRGNYWLYLLPSRETETNKTQAEKILQEFLKDNRNLGEFVSKIIWLEPVDLPLQIDIQLNDDVKDIADILAKIYMTAEEIVIEKPLRYTTEAMKEQGYSNEEIFDGPYLHHGWIPELPPLKNYDCPIELNLSPLVNRLLTIKGVQSVTRLELGKYDTGVISPLLNDNWSWKIVKGYYPRLWGQDPLALITSPDSPLTIIAKGGVKVSVSKEDIEKKLITEPLINMQPELLNWGKHRKVRDYYPVSNKLPACYGLQTDANTQQQKQLHQFMLPYEQILANGCAELALLPKLLAFKQRGNAVYGVQWPFKTNTISQKMHQEIMPDLIKKLNDDAQIDSNDRSYSKELEILDYLLGYFGAHRAARPLILSRQDFLSTQRGYLAQQPELAYHRNNIRIDKVSALQKRIAARLGLGKKCFNEPPDLADLPFYLIEHRRLLPVKPNVKSDKEQEHQVLDLDIKDNPGSKSHHLIITQKKEVVGQLLRGQMIDLIIKGKNEFTLRGQIITEITEESFYLDTRNSAVLEHRLKEVKEACKANNLFWCDSPVWLEDMDYQLVYDDKLHQSSKEDERWIVSNAHSPFPAMINKGDEITLKYVITPYVSPTETSTDSNSSSVYKLKANIVDFDRIEGRIKLKKIEDKENDFPPEAEAWRYRWYFSSEKYAHTDRFSFVVSIVINRQLIENSNVDPHKLESWVKTEILAEFPAHVSMIIHWLSPERFGNFASTYKRWQNNGSPLGDEAYHILEMLTLGRLPPESTGTGNMRIATEEQKNEVIKASDDELRDKIIKSNQLLYVPGAKIDAGTNDNEKNKSSENSQSQLEDDKNKD